MSALFNIVPEIGSIEASLALASICCTMSDIVVAIARSFRESRAQKPGSSILRERKDNREGKSHFKVLIVPRMP